MPDPNYGMTPKPVVAKTTKLSVNPQGSSYSATATTKPRSRLSRRLIGAAVAAVIACAAGGWWLSNMHGPTSDDLTPQQVAEMNASWAAAQSSGVQLEPVTSPEIAEALATIHLTPDQAETLKQDIASGKTSLVWVTVWDDFVEDGDVVALTSEGVRTEVKLKTAHTKIALPRPANGVIDMEGITDPGGGITVGIMSGTTPVEVSPMTPGQVIGIPIR